MKMRLTIFALLTASLTIFSCSKDKNTPNPEENGPGALMTKMIQGLVPGYDTVFVFNYDANNRIKSVINVSDLDTFEASFNTTGLVMTIIAKGPGSLEPGLSPLMQIVSCCRPNSCPPPVILTQSTLLNIPTVLCQERTITTLRAEVSSNYFHILLMK